MTTLVIIQLVLALALVILVLLQGSDNDSLGLGGGTSNGMMSARKPPASSLTMQGSQRITSERDQRSSQITCAGQCSTMYSRNS